MTSYTVKEIDELRKLCENKFLWGFYTYPKDWEGGWSRGHTSEEKTKVVEEMVRTFMLAGKKPKDFYKES